MTIYPKTTASRHARIGMDESAQANEDSRAETLHGFLERRSGERRKSNKLFAGPDKRRSNYDRRKITAKSKVRPAMSPNAGYGRRVSDGHSAKLGHDAGYVARFVADQSQLKRASQMEATKLYGRRQSVQAERLLRGLSIDQDIN